jgi:hypothetical protein
MEVRNLVAVEIEQMDRRQVQSHPVEFAILIVLAVTRNQVVVGAFVEEIQMDQFRVQRLPAVVEAV